MTRDERVHALAQSIKVEARVCALRRLADQTARTFEELRRHGVPVDVACGYFACTRLRERLDEKNDERSKP
jgi:hypothetical protein